jgi:hypothetical protein
MLFRVLADLTVIAHLGFVLFVIVGGLLVFRNHRVAWVHLPAALWGAWVELAGWICPLTPVEHWLREQGGEAAYTSGFVEHYIIPILYPAALSRDVQFVLAALVIGVNATVYTLVWRQARHASRAVPL